MTMLKEHSILSMLKRILLNNTGSTTVLLEAITNENITVQLDFQNKIKNKMLANALECNGNIIKRKTLLKVSNITVSQNIVFYNSDVISNEVATELNNGEIPLGKLLMNTDYRRERLYKEI